MAGVVETATAGFNERFAALDERVTNLRTSFSTLEASTARGFSQMEAAIAVLGNDIRSGQKTPWPIIWAGMSVLVTVLGIIGVLVTSPIKDSQSELKSAIKDVINALSVVPDKFVSRAEQQVLRDRGNQDRDALNETLRGKLERSEWGLRNDAINQQIAEVTRRVDEIRADFGATYSLRDALVDMKQRLERIEGRSPRTTLAP